MLLGKRPRPPMRRTASTKGITLDSGPQQEPSDGGGSGDALLHIAAAATLPEHVAAPPHGHQCFITATTMGSGVNGPQGYDHNFSVPAAVVSPRRNHYGTVEHMETAQFLRICGLCQRCLVPGRDIYMYRGEKAFCSLECREQQMKKDERKEKRTASAPK